MSMELQQNFALCECMTIVENIVHEPIIQLILLRKLLLNTSYNTL